MRTSSVFLVAVLGIGLGACSSSVRGPDLTAESNQLTTEAVTTLLAGDTDFVAIAVKLNEALALKPDNREAQLFLGAAAFLGTVQREVVGAGGGVRDLMERSGLLNTSGTGSLWDVELELQQHGEGLFINSMPRASEFEGLLLNKGMPALRALAAALESLPTNFEYVIPAANTGMLGELLSPGQPIALRLDYGDVRMAAAAVNGLLALVQLGLTPNWDNLDPNDFDFLEQPNLDLVDVIDSVYVNLGTILRFGELAAAKAALGDAWASYKSGMDHLLGENATQAAEGLLTLGRDTFADPQERQEFVALEASVRAWVEPLFQAAESNAFHMITTLPTGDPLPPEYQVSLNFYRFWQGVDLRATFWKTVVDPSAGSKAIGVPRWADLDADLTSFGGLVGTIAGSAPTAGDFQELGYAVRIDAPPVHTKTIDGNFGDWAGNRVQIGGTPDAFLGATSPDLGSVWAAVDASSLFVHCDRSMTSFMTGDDSYRVAIEGPNGMAAVGYSALTGVHTATADTPQLMPVFAHSGGGIEIAFPLGSSGTGSWAEVTVACEADNATYQVSSERAGMFVKVR